MSSLGIPNPRSPEDHEAWQQARWAEVAGPQGLAGVVLIAKITIAGQTLSGVPGSWDPHTADGLTLSVKGTDGVTVDGQQVDGTVAISSESTIMFPGARIGSVGGGNGVYGLRVWDPNAPTISRLRAIDTYPFDPDWVIDAEYRPAATERVVAVQRITTPPSEDKVHSPGDLILEIAGHQQRLQVIETFPGQRLVVFTDATSGKQTPGIGRWLILPEVQAGTLSIDFNRVVLAHHSFSPVFPCPLPPAGNDLPLRVEAGERAPLFTDD